MKSEKVFNYFGMERNKKKLKNNKNIVRAGNVAFVCANVNQADLIRKWIKAGDNFEIK